MPTYSSFALDNFLEPKYPDFLEKSQLDSVHGIGNHAGETNPRHLFISPTLYVTPEQTPISEFSTPDPLSPSPYVVNHKRRRVRNGQRSLDFCQDSDFAAGNEGGDLGPEELDGESFGKGESLGDGADGGENDEGFCDSRVNSEEEASELGVKQIESRSFVSAQGEFFDAIDDFSSDASVSNTPSVSRMESELHDTRRSLFEEIEKRETTEKTFKLMCSQWERIHYLMSQDGLIFPAPPAACDVMQLEDNFIDQFTQEVVVTRFVSEAVGRGLGRAEAEETAGMVIESKDQEITRLRDRLQYYETVNHEMSQRNLLEVARRQQEKKRSRRWLWSLMGLSIGFGASFLAYSFIPQANKSLSLPKSGHSTDASCIGSSHII
ncbi:uncharacterized protein [Primulina huaijiensis]|uniref:uncharacterized protein n=1 Tax=Primulina huaijiensis TaxID=1492673 RepID=UPI003CC720C0